MTTKTVITEMDKKIIYANMDNFFNDFLNASHNNNNVIKAISKQDTIALFDKLIDFRGNLFDIAIK